MSETKHSPEPWRVVFGNDDERPYMLVSETPKERTRIVLWGGIAERATIGKHNARRTVACVNALAGVPTGALEAGALGKALDLTVRLHRLRVDGDAAAAEVLIGELLDALRSLGRLP